MSAGASLYLVSACGTAEEFVAAFRRYADRTGLFVPIREPLPAGRRGRIALALKDGGVMIDGEAEVVASSQRPSGIHARVGMTLKWVEPDEPSKTVIAELEKARLALKPVPPSVPPRPAEVPPEPRAVPPAPGGRIDAANALAECVLVGDISAFGAPRPPVIDESKSGAGKFVIPSIPPGGRGKPPTVPPALTPPRTKTPSQVPAIKPIAPKVEVGLEPTMQAAIPEAPPSAPKAAPSSFATRATDAAVPIPKEPARGDTVIDSPSGRADDTAVGITPPKKPELRDNIGTTLGVAPLAKPSAPARQPAPKATQIGFPAIKPPGESSGPTPSGTPFQRATPPQPTPVVAKPAGPPPPRQPTPFAPMPIVRSPAADVIVDPEKTDLSEIPMPPGDEPRSLGVTVLKSAQPAAAPVPAPESAPVGRSGGMRASQLMAAIGGQDWTMTPDAASPTILPAITDVEPEDSARATEAMTALDKPGADAETSGPGGDWTISKDPTAADGWTAPAKVEVSPIAAQPQKGNRVIAVASTEAIDAAAMEDKPTGIGEPLIEIDPTLGGVTEPMAVTAAPPRPMAPPPMPPPMMRPPMPPPTPHGAPFPQPPVVAPSMEDATSLLVAPKRRRGFLIAGVAAGAVALAAAGIVVLGHHGDHAAPAARTGSAAPAAGSAVTAEAPAPAAAVEPPNAVAPVAPVKATSCKIVVASTPPGAEIWQGETKLGSTPKTLELPCGVEAQLALKKAHFTPVMRAVVPGTDANVSLKLVAAAVATVSLRVTSSPMGATITMGGRVLGVTPTTIHVPIGGASLTLSKEGYTPDTERVSARPNSTHNVVLKRAPVRQRSH